MLTIHTDTDTVDDSLVDTEIGMSQVECTWRLVGGEGLGVAVKVARGLFYYVLELSNWFATFGQTFQNVIVSSIHRVL